MTSTTTSAFNLIDDLGALHARAAIETFTLPARVIDQLEEGGLKPDEIERIIGARSDLKGQAPVDAMLTEEQSDRAIRLAHIVSLAERVFHSREKAFFWLRLSNDQLGGHAPIEYLRREIGARFVEEELIRIDHGIAA